MPKIEMGKKYQTRDGRKVRVLAVDVNHTEYPVLALITNREGTREHPITYTSNGTTFPWDGNSADLIEVPEVIEGWVFIYESQGYLGHYYLGRSSIFDTLEAAQKELRNERETRIIGIAHISLPKGQGLE